MKFLFELRQWLSISQVNIYKCMTLSSLTQDLYNEHGITFAKINLIHIFIVAGEVQLS